MKLLVCVSLMASVSVFAAPLKMVAQGGSVEALAVGKPSFIKIRAKGAAPKGTLNIEGNKASGLFEFDVTTLDTGISLRDEHMHDKYLKTKEHPSAKLEIKDLNLKQEYKPAQKLAEPFKGTLTLHGVTKPVNGNFKVDEKNQVMADFKIKLSDFKIDIPKYAGITVAEDVTVEVKIAELKVAK